MAVKKLTKTAKVAKPAKPGPKVNQAEQLKTMVSSRYKDREIVTLRKLADKNKMSPAKYVRHLVIKAIESADKREAKKASA